MSTLTGNQIKDTYQGLLKLADSSTGITQTLQSVQDGLGNDTGIRIATNQIEGDGLYSFVPLKGTYYGTGLQLTNPSQYSNGTQNTLLAFMFYDNANYSYSAISTYTTTITSTSDTVEYGIYTAQMINPFGIYPATKIVAGITADTTSLGFSTFVFPSNISMSGYGAGVYFLVMKISNSGVQPTYRPSQSAVGYLALAPYSDIYGKTAQIGGAYPASPLRANNSSFTFQNFTGTTTFDNTFPSTLNTTQSSAVGLAGNVPGFLLHTVDA